MNKLLQASLDKYQAEISEALAILDVYFNNPVGIGEHPDLLAEIDKYIDKLDSAQSKLKTLRMNFTERNSKVKVDTAKKSLLKG